MPALGNVERPAGSVVTGTPTPFDPIIGAAATRSAYGVQGNGLTVAMIDTGVDYNNPALGGGFGPGAKVIAGYNFANDSGDPMATTSQHGTAVAGLIASSDPTHLGVAPGVNIVALKVTGDNNSASLDDIAQALQWVVDHHSQYNITVVNMSLSDGGNYAQNWFAHDAGPGQRITELVGQLGTLNIPVVSATGNSFNGRQGEGFTSIVDGVISVTATDTSGRLLPDAQRLGPSVGLGTMTEIAAPGAGFSAPSNSGGYSSVDGTSFAAPLVSGAVVLLQQIYQQRFGALPTVAQVTDWLEKGADPIHDSVTGVTFGQLDIARAAALIPSPKANPTPAPVTNVSYTPVVSTPSTPPTTTENPEPANSTPPQPPAPPSSPPVTVTETPAANANANTSTNTISNTTPHTTAASGSGSMSLSASAWFAGTSGRQIRIWNAPTEPALGTVIPAGALRPMNRMMMRMMRMRMRAR